MTTRPPADITRFVYDNFGPALTLRVIGSGDGADQRLRAVAEAFDLLAEDSGLDVAHTWMTGMNPHLDDEAPIRAISARRADEVLAAARDYAVGQNAA
ncbi:hypothetical protein ABZ746_30375 [Streptomyces sp. NPDC020096]